MYDIILCKYSITFDVNTVGGANVSYVMYVVTWRKISRIQNEITFLVIFFVTKIDVLLFLVPALIAIIFHFSWPFFIFHDELDKNIYPITILKGS